MTIPKLELSAAALLTKLFKKTKKIVKGDYTRVAWSDSTIALSWKKNTTNKLPTFVTNCANTIRATPLEWR